MTVVLDRPKKKSDPKETKKTAPFNAGDRLSRPEFERLYAKSGIKKAELTVHGIE